MEQSERHVREYQTRLEEQQILISKLKLLGDLDMISRAEEFLLQLKAFQQAALEHLALEQKLASAGG